MNCADLWKQLEEKLGCGIPIYVKNLLIHQGFDNIIALKSIDNDDIIHLENYGKSESYHKKIPKSAKQEDYLGIFENDRSNFEILRGHKKLVDEIATISAKLYESSNQARKGDYRFLKLAIVFQLFIK